MFVFFMSVAVSCGLLKEDLLVNVLSHGTRGTHAVRRNMPRAQPKHDVSGTDRAGAESECEKATFRKK